MGIQCETFNHIYDGNDIIGRARTGMGKTLAFVLPVIERLIIAQKEESSPSRAPKMLVMAPTRELAKQVADEVESTAPKSVRLVTIYGGAPYRPQEDALR